MEFITEMFAPRNLPIAVAVLLIIWSIAKQRRFQEEYLKLDDLARQRLQEVAGRFRLLRMAVTVFTLIVIVAISSRRSIVAGFENPMIAAAGAVVIVWYAFGYQQIAEKLSQNLLPDSFIRAYTGDRWAMMGALLLLLISAWMGRFAA